MSSTAIDIDRRLGDRVRQLRLEAGLTIDALASSSGVSRAMLSRIERGESNPTASLLGRVCAGLGITLARLFADAEPDPSPLRRLADQPVWHDPVSRYLRRGVAGGPGMDLVEIEFPPGADASFPGLGQTGADQHVWAVEGTIDVEHRGVTIRLEPGDCLLTRPDEPVRFRNPTGRPARYALVISQGRHRP